MNRKEFLKKTSLAIGGFSLTGVFACNFLNFETTSKIDLATLSDELNTDFSYLMTWLETNNWLRFLKTELRLNLNAAGDALLKELIQDIDVNGSEYHNFKKQNNGFDDFAGNKLIEPGSPALSLLYHMLASPRVRLPNLRKENYPTLLQLDTLENFIYGLKKWDDYRQDYNIKDENDLALAVFAYEYRPSHKTPHRSHADLVYSRTGVARIGEMPMNYDAVNRSFTNKPLQKDDHTGKKIAVTPARYGLFLAKVVGRKEISLMTTGEYKTAENGDIDKYDDRDDANRLFLLPVRKVFNNDLLVNNEIIQFRENHVSEKLFSLDLNPAVPKRVSSDLIETSSKITNIGSSFLVISLHQPLVRLLKGVHFTVDKIQKNRYFTSYSEKEKEGFEIELYENSHRKTNNYKAGRNKPMYVHISHQMIDSEIIKIPQDAGGKFEKKIKKGGYKVPIYEDSICDGTVSVDISSWNNIKWKTVYGAFSIVTAPDFFPYVDLFDIIKFDVPPGVSNESNFYEGGVASLASARIRPNPKLRNPVDSAVSAFPSLLDDTLYNNTFTAVLSNKKLEKEITSILDYDFNSFLPDVCSSVFAPGWDVTYGDEMDTENVLPFLSTQGLGSPFVEDMKLCAAMNGMWAVASPDTARVFQGTVTEEQKDWYANPTAIPLMDDELGFHKNSPAKRESVGWDGEQGAFLEKIGNSWMVNFTDLGRADYVQNALDGKFDMYKLRELRSAELISRMSALKKCIGSIRKEHVASTTLWLVSAEKYENGKFEGNGIPDNLFGNNKNWATTRQFSIAPGENTYLYVFADTIKDKKQGKRQWAETGSNVKRRRQPCTDLYVCQVSYSDIKVCKVIKNRIVVSPNWE